MKAFVTTKSVYIQRIGRVNIPLRVIKEMGLKNKDKVLLIILKPEERENAFEILQKLKEAGFEVELYG